MDFEEWWKSYVKPASIYTLEKTAKDAWDAAWELAQTEDLDIAYMKGYSDGKQKTQESE